MEEYKHFVHCADDDNFYYIQKNEMFCIDKYNNKSQVSVRDIYLPYVNKMVLCQRRLVFIQADRVSYNYDASFIVHFYITDTSGIEILKICKSYIIYKLRDKWHIESCHLPNIQLCDVEDAQYMWCHAGALYKYDGQDIYLLQKKYREFKVYKKIDKSCYTTKYIGDYIVIRHHCKKIVLHPDGSISLLRCTNNEIIEIESDENSIMTTDDSGDKYLYARDSMHHTLRIKNPDCVYQNPRQVKSARNI
jgi:hypothetical protein